MGSTIDRLTAELVGANSDITGCTDLHTAIATVGFTVSARHHSLPFTVGCTEGKDRIRELQRLVTGLRAENESGYASLHTALSEPSFSLGCK